jgi:hypothetical protein
MVQLICRSQDAMEESQRQIGEPSYSICGTKAATTSNHGRNAYEFTKRPFDV